MSGNQDTVYLLHSRPYRETSQLATLFGRHSGRFSAVARATRSGKGNALRPFARLEVRWRGRSDLKTLSGIESSRMTPLLQGRKLYVGLYLNELLMRLLHENEPHEALFDRYEKVIDYLSGDYPVEPGLRLFELALLEDLGYGLQLDADRETGEPVRADAVYVFRPEEGGVTLAIDDGGRALYRGRDLLALSQRQLTDPAVLRAAKRLTREAIEPYLGGRPLASRALFRGGSAEGAAS